MTLLVCQSYVIRNRFINPIFVCGVKINPFINPVCGQIIRPCPDVSKKVCLQKHMTIICMTDRQRKILIEQKNYELEKKIGDIF